MATDGAEAEARKETDLLQHQLDELLKAGTARRMELSRLFVGRHYPRWAAALLAPLRIMGRAHANPGR